VLTIKRIVSCSLKELAYYRLQRFPCISVFEYWLEISKENKLLKTIMQTLLGGVVGGGVALAGNTFTYWNKNRELDIRMVDVALTILSAKDDGTKSEYARRYAVDLLDNYGGVKITYKDNWVQDKSGVPIGSWALFGKAPTGSSGWESARVPESQEFEEIVRRYLEARPIAKDDSRIPLPPPN
jgi:hypothetical protein